MATATVMRAWQDQNQAHLAVMVDEGSAQGKVEYIGSVPLADLQGLTGAQIKAALVAAAKAVRDNQQAAQSTIGGITGTVTI